MHLDHDTFIQAAKERKKVILSYFSGQNSLFLTKLCIPIQFCPSETENSSDCYYFWDPEAELGERLLGLFPSEIANMLLSDEIFDPAKYIIPEAY